VQRIAGDEEQVAFWRRHTHLGVALCVVIPVLVALRSLTVPAVAHRDLLLGLATAVAVLSPLLLRVPVARVVRHPRGRLFFDAWEGAGILLVALASLLDGGARSPYTAFFYVLLAHAALAYPPAGMVLAGSGVVAGYVGVGVLAGGVPGHDLLQGALTLGLATGTCAIASYNHALAYRRTAAYARQIAVLAERDGLTGCLNHRTFHQRLQAEALVTTTDRPLCLLIIDVDSFKTVNDTHGHPAGDGVLQLVGKVLIAASRRDDAAGRLGGDEFALLLPATTRSEAVAVGERLLRQVREQAADFGVTVSIGAATTTLRADGTGLLAAADLAVYRAKRAGRDRLASCEGPVPPAVPPARRAPA
jgi:diguanylate cyclase (GGDEF)-like protein